MTDGIVGWQFFDAESGSLPEEFSPSVLPDGGAGRIVVLAATPFARAEGWATRAVVAIARAWAQGDLRIFLMDLGLDAPTLHDAVGLPNLEGVSDAFLYGASVQRIAQPALNDTIFFAPAGTATTDPEQILAHPRWNDLAGGFSEADATLLLYLPTEIPGSDKILDRATDVLLLAGQGESIEAHLGEASSKILGMCGPMGSAPGAGEDLVSEPRLDEGFSDLSPDVDFVPEVALNLPDDFEAEEGLFTDSGDLDLDRGLKLAEGFSREVSVEEETPSETVGPEEVETPPSDRILDADRPGEIPDGPGGKGTPDLFEREISDPEVPDFGVEFAEMPGLEEGAVAQTRDADLPGEMIPGSDLSLEATGPGHGYEEPEELSEAEQESPSETGSRPRASGKFASDRDRPMSRRRPPPRRRTSFGMIGVIGAALAILLAGLGTIAGFYSVPGFGWLNRVSVGDPVPEVVTPDPLAVEPVLRFSLEVDTYAEDELGLAINMLTALRDRPTGLLFHLTPREVGGAISYLLYVGPATDAVEAENLKAPLEEILIREDPESWSIRDTPLAFSLGRRETLVEAQEYLAIADLQGAFGYIVQVSFPDGTVGYEILSGAFQTPEDAGWWRLALQEAGFPDLPLIERRGRPPE
jgi:hypothetical protein